MEGTDRPCLGQRRGQIFISQRSTYEKLSTILTPTLISQRYSYSGLVKAAAQSESAP